MKQVPLDDGLTSMIPTAGFERKKTVKRSSQQPAKHVNPGCTCRTIEAPNRSIKEILKSGGIPLLSIDEKLNLRAKPYDGRTKFVVIQHTHIDGLASSQQGTITTCQLLRIALRLGELASDIRGDLCFWLDTLCEEKKRASPSLVFKEAHAIVIVDPALEGLRNIKDVGDVKAHLADIMAGHPRLALNKKLLLMGAYGFLNGSRR